MYEEENINEFFFTGDVAVISFQQQINACMFWIKGQLNYEHHAFALKMIVFTSHSLNGQDHGTATD